MPVQYVRKIEVREGGVGVGVPAGKLSVSLLSSWRGSGLVGRTSHELEGHGHALLIVRHVCGISWGVVGLSGGGGEGGVGDGLVCLLEYAIGRSRSSTKEEAASPEAAAHVPGQAGHSLAGDLRLQQSRTGACYTIDPSALFYASPLHPQCSPLVPSTCSGSAPCLLSAPSSL